MAERPDAADIPTQSVSAPLANQQQGQDTGCDLSGRWLMTEHRLISVLDASQVAFSWFYVELTQEKDQVTMTVAMNCGGTTKGLPIIEVQLDDSPAWPAYMKQVRYDGRTGTATEDGELCQITFERAVLVRGATVAMYRDLELPLPELEQPASDETPGWEDWDDDGHPGVTVRVDGVLSGQIYETSRTWSTYQGSTPRDVGSFMLDHQWRQERVTLGFEDSPLLSYEGVRFPDESQQIVELTRLLPDEAVGDDASKCQAVRALAPALTPHASMDMLPR